jgi:CheY-like chemotaxis protein
MILHLYGYEVTVAADGPTALQRIQVSQPDVVLLDIALPGMDGWRVAEQIRERRNRKRPFLIAITGYGTMADQLQSWKRGIDLHLVKPVDPEHLRRVLARFQTLIMRGAAGIAREQRDQQAPADLLASVTWGLERGASFLMERERGQDYCKCNS